MRNTRWLFLDKSYFPYWYYLAAKSLGIKAEYATEAKEDYDNYDVVFTCTSTMVNKEVHRDNLIGSSALKIIHLPDAPKFTPKFIEDFDIRLAPFKMEGALYQPFALSTECFYALDVKKEDDYCLLGRNRPGIIDDLKGHKGISTNGIAAMDKGWDRINRIYNKSKVTFQWGIYAECQAGKRV